MMRHGDNPKLAPAAEAALLESLRAEREIKAHEKMQAEAQRLAVTLAALDLRELPAKAKDLSADKKFGELSGHAAMAITLNTILRRVPHKTDGDDKKPKKPAGKPKAGGGAKVTKVVDVPPCTAAEARKVIRANKVSLAAACDGPAAQLALLRAAQAWLLSANGAVALPGAAKVIEVLYDLDLASEGVLHEFWALVGASAQRDATSLLATKEARSPRPAPSPAVWGESLARPARTLFGGVSQPRQLCGEKPHLTSGLNQALAEAEVEEAAAAKAAKAAESQHAEAMAKRRDAEWYAQQARCGGNPSKEDEIAEKAANAAMKKAVDLHGAAQNITAARDKTLVAKKAELEASKRAHAELQGRVDHALPFVTHARPFFDWLAASDDDDDDDDPGEHASEASPETTTNE